MGNKRKVTKTRRILNLIFVGLEIVAWIALGTACMLYLRANGHSDSVSAIPLIVGIALSILYAVRITNDQKLTLIEQNDDIIQRLDDIEARLMGKPVQKRDDIDEIEKELKAVEDRMVKSVAELDTGKKSRKQAKSSEEKASEQAENKAKAESIGLFARLRGAVNKPKEEEKAPEETAETKAKVEKKPAKKTSGKAKADKAEKTDKAEKSESKAKSEKSAKKSETSEKPAAKKSGRKPSEKSSEKAPKTSEKKTTAKKTSTKKSEK